MALIKCKECGKEISDKAKVCVNCGCLINVIENKETTPKDKNVKKIILIIVIVLILIIGFIFASRYLGIIFNLEFGSSSNNEKFAICSNNSNTIEYIQGNLKETHIKHISHSENSYLSDRICTYLKTLVYSYDKDANVQCRKQDFYATYYRKNSFEDTINDYTNNDEYHCVIYDDTENNEKNKIIGSWCGLDISDTNIKYTFNDDGTIEYNVFGASYSGYYGIENNYISYGKFLTSRDYYIILLDDYFYYDENTDIITLTSKSTDDKYNNLKRCN